MKQITIPNQRLVHGSHPPLTHTIHSECGGCGNLSEDSCYKALNAIRDGKKPDDDAWHSIYASVDEPWSAETGGAMYTRFFSKESDALDYMDSDQNPGLNQGILSWGNKAWVHVSWFAHKSINQ